MSKAKNCKICGESSGKRNVCEDCKKDVPYKESTRGYDPFNRKELFDKLKK